MALIEVFHVVASQFPVARSGLNLPQGTIVAMQADGSVARCDGTSATAWPLGLAGDSASTGVTSYTPESGSSLTRNPTTSLEGGLVMGAAANTTGQIFTQNRVSDNYNEVFAAGQMTVYHSGGEFWTDQFELVRTDGSTLCTYTNGSRLYSSGGESANAGLEPEGQAAGRFTDAAGSNAGAVVVGLTLTAPNNYPNGVPGTDVAFSSALNGGEGGNSMTYGRYLHVKLMI